MRRLERMLAVTAAVALLAAACADDEPAIDPTPPPTPPASPTAPTPTASLTPSPTTAPSPSPTVTDTASPSPIETAAGGVPELRSFCLLEPTFAQIEHIEFAYPVGWQVAEEECEFFDPELEQLEEGTEPDAAVSVDVEDVAFSEAAGAGPGTRDEIQYVGAVSGYPAVRERAETTGEGLRPEGEPTLSYLLDLSAGSDEASGTLIASARPSTGADFELAAAALDRMARTFRVVPSAFDGQEPFVVTRVVHGPTPYTVTYEAGCLRLHLGGPDESASDEVCDLAASDGISGAILAARDLQVVVGLAPPATAFVVSDAASAPHGAFTLRFEEFAAFAYEVVDAPVEVRALDVDGGIITTTTIE